MKNGQDALSNDDRSRIEGLRELDDDAILVALGRVLFARDGIARSSPPTDADCRAAGETFLQRRREDICQLVSSQPHVIHLMQSNELIDLTDKAGALVLCFKATFGPVIAPFLALCIVRHGLRWLCPELVVAAR